MLLLLLWIMWYLAFSTRTILAPFLPMIKNEFVLSNATAGGLYIFIAAGGTIGLLYAGTIASRIGAKTLIIISFFIAAGSLSGIYASSAYLFLSLWLFVFGLSGGVYLPCAIPVLTAAFDREHWGKAISFHETAASISILTIPYLTVLLLSIMPWRGVFLVLAAAFAFLIPVFWVASPPTSRAPQSVRIGILSVAKRAEFRIFVVLWTISATGAMGVYSILPLFLVEERHMAIETANRILSISRIGGVLGQIAAGFFLDRYDTGKIIILLMVGSTLSSFGLGLADTNAILIAMLFFQATFCVIFFPVGIVAISKLTTPGERAVFSGTVMAVSTILGLGLAPFLLGLIADTWRFQYGFIMLGISSVGTIFLAVRLQQRLSLQPD